VIVTEYEPPRNHVVLKATIYSLGESGSAEGASLYVKHEREEDEEYERALFVMPHRCQFHQHFSQDFFVRKCFAQLSSGYCLALYFFGIRILAQKLLVKC